MGKKIVAGILAFVVALGVALGVLNATGLISLSGLLQRVGILRPADYLAPEGEGDLLDGALPDDGVPDAESRYSFSAELYPFRAMLGAAEQAAYNQVYANAMELYEQFPLHTPLTAEGVGRVMVAIFNDQPGLFWLETAYRYSYTSDGQVVALTLSFNEAAGDIAASRGRFDAAAARVLEGANACATAVEREKYVHDWLVENVAYRKGAPMNQSAYSALVGGETVCAGYARAFQYLMQQLGLACYFCTGDAGEAHAWNILRLDGEFYNVDVTWDDTGGAPSYAYFNLTDAAMGRDHTREGLSLNLPACAGTAHSYENTFGGGAGDTAGDGNANPGGDTDPAGNDPPAPAPAQSTPPAPAYRTPEEVGLARDQAIAGMDAYYAACEEQLVALGGGTHTFTLLLANGELAQAVLAGTNDQTAPGVYLPAAAQRLGFASYTANVSVQAEQLADGYCLLTQTVELAGELAASTSEAA